jgi:hypothetical protein
MAIVQKKIGNSLITRDDRYSYRWLDAIGESVVKYVLDVGEGFDDTTGDPTAWTNTEVGTNSIVAHTTEGGGFLVTTGGTEYNGVNMQLDGAGFKLESGKPCYFGIKFKSADIAKGDFLFGLCEIDTTLMATSSAHAVTVTDDGVYFYHLNDETDVTFSNELGGVVGSTAVGITHDASYHVYEIYYDGSDLFAYYDNSLVVRITSGIANVAMTPSFNIRAGDDGAEVMDIQWIRAFQLRS